MECLRHAERCQHPRILYHLRPRGTFSPKQSQDRSLTTPTTSLQLKAEQLLSPLPDLELVLAITGATRPLLRTQYLPCYVTQAITAHTLCWPLEHSKRPSRSQPGSTGSMCTSPLPPSDRDQSLEVSRNIHRSTIRFIQGDAKRRTRHPSLCPIVHVSCSCPSRGQCRATALDLLTYCALETERRKGYSHASSPQRLRRINRLPRRVVADYITKGVGFFPRA